MKSCILFTSHLNTPEKIDTAHMAVSNIKKETDLPIIFTGNYPIPISIQQQVNYSLYTDKNPIAKKPRIVSCGDAHTIDYGFANFTQILLGMEFCKSLGFDYAHQLNYDVFLEDGEYDRLIEKSKNGDFLYYPWGDDGWNGICVEFFSIKTQEYIDIIKPVLHYYDNNNPPGIREDWHGEWFFEWACKFSNLHPTMKNFCDVKHKSVMGSGGRDE